MRWSKLRSLIEESIAESVAKRISVHSAAYGECTCGHCWITLDKEVIANFCTRAYYNKKLSRDSAHDKIYKEHLVMYGELSRQDAYLSMFDFVHRLSIDEALNSDDVLVQALAVIDSRVGKMRLTSLDTGSLHPLTKKLLEVRLDAENISGAA